jgi:hypothetical protein
MAGNWDTLGMVVFICFIAYGIFQAIAAVVTAIESLRKEVEESNKNLRQILGNIRERRLGVDPERD